MKNLDLFVDAGNIKFRTAFRDSMYDTLRKEDDTGLFNSIGETFCTAFTIGYHFNKTHPIGKNAINHVNLVSIDRETKELMAQLIMKKKPEIIDPKVLWNEVEQYAEYGIQVLFNSWKENHKMIDIEKILEADA